MSDREIIERQILACEEAARGAAARAAGLEHFGKRHRDLWRDI